MSVLILLLACRKAPLEPPPVAPESALPALEPLDPELIAVVEAGTAIACNVPGGDCPVPPCASEDACESVAVLAVGVVGLAAGRLELPYARGRMGAVVDPPCDSLEVSEEEAPRVWNTRRAVAEVDVADVRLADVVDEDSPLNWAWSVDLDGDGDDEVLAETGSAGWATTTWIVGDGAASVLVEDTEVAVDEEAGEEAAMRAAVENQRLRLRGLTDVELDGVLEVVVVGSGYEASWKAVGRVVGGRWELVGSAGCSI